MQQLPCPTCGASVAIQDAASDARCLSCNREFAVIQSPPQLPPPPLPTPAAAADSSAAAAAVAHLIIALVWIGTGLHLLLFGGGWITIAVALTAQLVHLAVIQQTAKPSADGSRP